jgi:SWI/SNF-related matrix-associated actin-dependent regulator 1 of chromatin subfamily A
MKIKKLKSKYHKYILQFDYCPQYVAKIKDIQKNLNNTWKDLSFYKNDDNSEVGWVFSSSEVFNLICNNFNPFVEDNVKKEFDIKINEEEKQKKREEKLDDINIDKIDDNLKIPTKKELFDFQKKAVSFVDKVGGRALIGDEMGLGKTIEAIGYAVFKNYGSILVICPASVKENWRREIKSFSGISSNILTETDERGGWEIIGYSNLEKYYNYLKKNNYQLIICDESHYIKNKKAIRTKKTLNLLKKAKDVIFLTGTPILNKPEEIYNIFNFIRPMPFWGEKGFAMRYCGLKQDPFGRWDYSGSSNLDELKNKMSFMIKRSKKEVLSELPEKTINIVETEMESWIDYRNLLNDYREWLLGRKLSEKAIYAEALTKANYLKQIVVENKNIEKIIDDFLENGKKLIVFSQYRFLVNRLQNKYSDISVKLTGETPTTDRQVIIDKFQKNSSVRIFFSTIKAGGVGITLTEADTVIFTDLDWTPATHQQAEDRAYRIGQKNNVNVYYLITSKTIEEKIWKLLKRKEIMINKIMEGEETRKVRIKTLLKNL